MMGSWAIHEDMWVRRTAILCQLASKKLTDVDLSGLSRREALKNIG